MTTEGYTIRGKKVLVVGLGRSGVSLCKYLCSHGANVVATDERNKSDLKGPVELLEKLERLELQLGRHVLKSFQEPDLIIVSPGVPLDSKHMQTAIKEGVPVIGEFEFAASLIKEPIIAVTGTNGKTTAVTLIHEMLTQSGIKSWLGGNTGTPLMEYVNQKVKAEVVVAEVSSFQLETAPKFHPHTAVLLNITADHMDRHKTLEAYMAAKGILFRNMTPKDHVIYNGRCSATHDTLAMNLKNGVPAYPFTHGRDQVAAAMADASAQGAYLKRGELTLKFRGKVENYNTENYKPMGTHNKENLAAAALAARLNGATRESIQKVIETFNGLEHRLEFVARKNAVNFYNDSKATNVDSLVRALSAFNESIILIAGGRAKGCDFANLIPHIGYKLKNIILYGEAKEALNRAIGDECETFLVGTFEEAVLLAYQKSRSGDTVLLSPGCSSLDMFESYAERGNYFKQLINQF